MSTLKYFSCIVLLALSSRIYSQIPDTIWTKTFGGPLADVGNSVKQTNDGGFIVTGTTSSFGAGGQDIWLIKTDENGDTLWTKTFGGIGNDRAANVVQTNDYGYAIFGTTNSYGNGGDDFLLWKTDSLGNTEWYKAYGTDISEVASEGQQTSDGGFIIVGYFFNQYYRTFTVKTDDLGNEIWNKSIGRISSDLFANSVQQTNNNDFLLFGTWRYWYSGSYRYNFALTKLSSNGDSLFVKTYERVGMDGGRVIKKTQDGNFILGGSSAYDYIWLIKVNEAGGIIWTRSITGTYQWTSLRYLEVEASGYIIPVTSELNDFQILKTDNNGIVQWEKMIGGSSVDKAYSVYPLIEGGYIVTGETESFGAGDSDIWLLKFKYNPPDVQINFFPPIDTAWIFGGCTGPDLVAHNLISTPTRDSITIEPGPSSYFFYYDSLGNQILVDKYYFIVEDSLNQYDYELWFHPKSWPPFNPVQITFDSVFYFQQNLFDIQLLVKLNGNPIDSLSQLFKAEWGLGVEETGEIPQTFSLSQNYPNPFNPSTKIKFEIPSVTLRQAQSDNWVILKVYDVLGNEVATLVNEEKQPGTYEVEFSIHSDEGRNLSSGIYFYQLKVGDPETSSGQGFVETKKMVLVR